MATGSSPKSLLRGEGDGLLNSAADLDENSDVITAKATSVSSNVTVKQVETEEEMRVCIDIRFKVFVEGIKVPAEEEVDEYDTSPGNVPSRVLHLLACVDGVPAGTARLVFDFDPSRARAKIGRVATLDEFRRKGVATALLRACEEAAKDRGFEGVKLGAIHTAVDLYKRNGYMFVPGQEEPFDDCGFVHYWMELKFK